MSTFIYRDFGNNKKWGDVIFSNPRNLHVDTITKMAEKVLIDQTYFVASKANVADLHFREYSYDDELDHNWHECCAFQLTDEPQNDLYRRSIEEFIELLQSASTL